MSRLLALILGVFFFMSGLYAGDSSVGCGLGSMIWKENTLVSATFRLTTNASFSNQFFGITTGTSGCSQHGIVQSEMAPIYYAEANLEQLKLQMAQGQGEYLFAFAESLGCSGEKNQFGQLTQSHYQQIFPTGLETPQQMLQNVKQVVSHSTLKDQCHYTVI